MIPVREGHRNPYVGAGADGARRSAQIDREERDTLDAADPRHGVLEQGARRWEEQAASLEAAPRAFTITLRADVAGDSFAAHELARLLAELAGTLTNCASAEVLLVDDADVDGGR